MNEEILEINGIIDGYGWQRSNIRYALNKCKGKKVRCKVNSWGGSVNEAIAISKMFEEHGDVTVEFVGFCASAATWMAFGAKSIEIYEDSLWLCHKSTVLVSMYKTLNADELDATIQKLQNDKKSQEAIDLIIAKKYADRCKQKGKNLQDVFELMKQERWMTATEALEWGFVDRMIPGINKANNEYRAMLAENCAALQFPMLPPATQQDEPANEDIVDRFINGVKTLFNKNTNQNQSQAMEKQLNLPLLAALLAVNAIQSKDGVITLNEEQLNNIEAALGQKNKAEQDLQAVNAQLDAISDNIKSIEGTDNKIKAVAAVINMIPSGAPAGTQIPPKDKSEDFTSNDPVNDYLKNKDDF